MQAKLMMLLCWLMLAQPTCAERLWLVANSDDAYHGQFAESLGKRLGSAVVVHPPGEPIPTNASRPTLVITMGEPAARASRDWSGAAIHTFITEQQFRAIYSDNTPQNHGAVFLDQPPDRFAQLARIALPNVKRLVVPLGKTGKLELETLRAAAARAGLTLHAEAVNSPQSLDDLLARTNADRDAVLLLPDPALRTNAMMKIAVVGSYKRRLPLITYSEGLVLAGALMAVHTTVSLLADEVAARVRAVYAGDSTLGTSHPAYFEVAVNYQLARALDLSLPTEGILRAKLKERDGAH